MQNCEYEVRDVLKFTIPLILTSLSASFMFNVDRLVLAHYSIDSMNASALAGNFVATMSFVVTSIAQVATVFVGQYNGLGEYKKTGWAPWQMMYLGILSFLVFIPLAVFCNDFGIFPKYCEEEGVKYLKIIMAFAGVPAISNALSAFFAGRGQSFVIIVVILLVNIINFSLNICLVFGINGFISPMGAKGSAIATVTGETINVIILLFMFLKKNNRTNYNTLDYKFRKKLFFDCVKIGLPLSLGKLLSMLAWFIILSAFSHASRDLATIEAFAVSIWIIFIFFADGSGRAISSLSANLIGKNNLPEIDKLLKLFLSFNFVICVIFSVPLIFYQDMMFWLIEGANGNIAHLRLEFHFVLISLWMIIFSDGIYYLVCGVLSSGGDTKFPPCLELTTLWVGVVIPTVVLYFTGNLTTVRVTYALLPITGAINSIVIYNRYKKLKWFAKLV